MKIYHDLNSLPVFTKAVVTIGSFDGLHTGHRQLIATINELASDCEGESVAITFNPHPRQVIYPNDDSMRLLNTIEEKIMLFKDTGIDHLVVAPFSIEFSQISSKEYIESFLLKKFNPRYIVIGYDHRFGLNRQGDIKSLQAYESDRLAIIEIEKQEIDDLAISSSKIRSSITNGYIDKANTLLSHPYVLIGKVVHGKKIGHKIGYPTANLKPLHRLKLIPAKGIYAVRIELEEVIYEGMLYIGTKPTVDDEIKLVIEVNIFDFDQNIYGKEVCLHFIEFVREDQKFDDLTELTLALKRDEERVKKIFKSYNLNQNLSDCTIAILNYNGLEYLEAYLGDVEFSTRDKVDVLVIDNASTDGSADYIKSWHPGVKVNSLSQNYGFSEGYNQGLKGVNTPYTVILNSDVKVTENWLDPLIKIMEADGSIGCIQPKVRSLENPDEFEYAGAAGGYLDSLGYPFCRGRLFDTVEKDSGQYDDQQEVFWASGAAMIIRTRLFKKLGGFDKDFFAHMEEIDLCWRVKRAGYKVIYSSASTVYHLGGGTLSYDSSNKIFLNFRNNLALLTKNEKKSKLLWKIPARLILDGIAALRFLMGGNISSFMAVLRAHFSYYRRFFALLEQRKIFNSQLRDLSIGSENLSGRYTGNIITKYFISGKKKFSDL